MLRRLFESLTGTWQLDRRLGGKGYMKGGAYFQSCEECVLFYQESGRAVLSNGQAFTSHCTYAYVYEGDTIAVYFWDSRYHRPARLLHRLRFCRYGVNSPVVTAEGVYKCVEDVYKSRYLFFNPCQFHLIYQVRGPAKDYTITSFFRKMCCV